MPKPTKSSQRYMPGLDGLRAIAVLAVILYHLEIGWAQGGLLGVGVFFTLSGYLITDLLLGQREISGRLNLGDFWIRRARRLLPALFLVLAVVVVWVALFDRSQLPDLRGYVAAAVLYVSNWWNIIQEASYFARFGPPQPLEHLWSLGIEEQFYLVWPWLLWLGLRFVRGRYRMALLTLILAAVSATLMAVLYQPGYDPTRVYEGTDTRVFGLLIGAALAMVWPSRHLGGNIDLRGRWRLYSAGALRRRGLLDGAGVAGLIIMALLMWRTDQYSGFLYEGGIVIFSVATALVVAAVAHPASRIGSTLGWSLLRWIGVRSYGMYLWHYPVIVLAPAAPQGLSIPVDALKVAVILVLSDLSWRYFEEPIRRGAIGRLWKQLMSRGLFGRPKPKKSLSALAGTMCALIIVGASLAGMIPTAPVSLQAETNESTDMKDMEGGLPEPSTEPSTTAENPPPANDSTTQQATTTPSSPPTTETTRAQTTPAPSNASASSAPSASKSSCDAVAYVGDSTSEGMISPKYLPNEGQRLEAQLARVGATSHQFGISGARSVVETLSPDLSNGEEAAKQIKSKGFSGCWMIALGTNDTANVHIGSNVDRMARIEKMMSVIGDQPVLWVTATSLRDGGPYSQANMKLWNDTLSGACSKYPNMRIFDWSSVANDNWFTSDGNHYTSEGYRNRAQLSADALAHAFPAGKKKSTNCTVN